jgi:transposase
MGVFSTAKSWCVMPRRVMPTGDHCLARGGQVVIRMLANVQQATLHPIIEKPKARTSILTSIASTPGFLVSATATRPSAIVEANTPGTRTAMASARSTPRGLLVAPAILAASRHLTGPEGQRSKKLPLYLGFFQFVHNARRRGKALLGSLIEALVA